MSVPGYESRAAAIATSNNITNNYEKWLLIEGCYAGISEDIITSIVADKTIDEVQKTAKLTAVLLGIEDLSLIASFKDIEKHYLSVRPADTEMDNEIKKLKESMDRKIDELGKDITEAVADNNNKLSQCIDCLLELSECNLALLEEVYNEKKLLMQVSEIDIEKPIYDLGFKILNKQNELFNEQFAGDKISRLEKKVDKILSSLNIEVTSEEKEKNTLFGRKNKKSESEKVKVSETHRVQEPNVEEAFKKYDSVVKRINTSPSTDVFDVFDLIRTGVFNKEQTKVIEEAIKRHLTIVEILQFAKPENTADTMEQLLSYLISVREGSAVKKARDRQIPENITKNINKRKTDNNEEEQ